MSRLDDTPGVPLEHYRDVHQCCVSVQCTDCKDMRYYRAADVITALDARGFDGAKVGVLELAKHYRARCRVCDGDRFETRPAFHMREPGFTAFWTGRA